MPGKNCYTIPENVSFEQAVLCEPLSVGMYAIHLAEIGEQSGICIMGAGPIGLSVMMAALQRGVGTVCIADPLDYRVDTAVTHGAAWGGNPDELASAVLSRDPEQLEAVFECSGRQEALDLAIEVSMPGGKIVIIGIPEFDRFSFDAHTARRKELQIIHVRRQNNFIRPALQVVAFGSISPDFLITHHFSIDEAGYAFDLIERYEDGVIKAMVHF
jgi:L-iditol 2-dehydrogenase